MPSYSFEGRVPVVDPSAFVHPSAVLIGDVFVGAGVFIGPGASLRGDFGRIRVATQANVQDNCVLHTGSELDCIVERGATIGHGVVLHGCTVGSNVLVGMNSVVLDGAVLGEESLVAALSLVRSSLRAPPRSLVSGNPAVVKRELSASEVLWRADGEGPYERLAARCRQALVPCDPLLREEEGRLCNIDGARAVRLRDAKP